MSSQNSNAQWVEIIYEGAFLLLCNGFRSQDTSADTSPICILFPIENAKVSAKGDSFQKVSCCLSDLQILIRNHSS